MKTAAVLAGGFSSEKEVSVRSGANVCAALKEAGWDACILDPAAPDFSFEALKKYDIVYPVTHGTFGEDGTLQGVLRYYGIPFVGCGAAASALTMDKNLTKSLFAAIGMPCPWGFNTKGLSAEEALNKITAYPVFVKPVSEGSSVGAIILHNKEQGQLLLPQHLMQFPECLVETYIPGREMTTGLAFYKGQLLFLPILEVAPKNEFYDYHAKYTPGMSRLICPAPMPEETRLFVETHCKNAYRFFGLEGCIRVDFILHPEKGPYFLEINTSPGMTATSDIPAMLGAANIPLPEFCSTLCTQAMEKWGRT